MGMMYKHMHSQEKMYKPTRQYVEIEDTLKHASSRNIRRIYSLLHKST